MIIIVAAHLLAVRQEGTGIGPEGSGDAGAGIP